MFCKRRRCDADWERPTDDESQKWDLWFDRLGFLTYFCLSRQKWSKNSFILSFRSFFEVSTQFDSFWLTFIWNKSIWAKNEVFVKGFLKAGHTLEPVEGTSRNEKSSTLAPPPPPFRSLSDILNQSDRRRHDSVHY